MKTKFNFIKWVGYKVNQQCKSLGSEGKYISNVNVNNITKNGKLRLNKIRPRVKKAGRLCVECGKILSKYNTSKKCFACKKGE